MSSYLFSYFYRFLKMFVRIPGPQLFLASDFKLSLKSDEPILYESYICSLLDCICMVWILYFNIVRKFCKLLVLTRTFEILKTTIFIFSFCIGFVTELRDLALGVLKHHYSIKRICETLINQFNQLLCYANIKGSCLFVT